MRLGGPRELPRRGVGAEPFLSFRCSPPPALGRPRLPRLPPCSQAKEQCPQLIVVPFMFEQYEFVSEKVSEPGGAGT